MLCMHVSNLFTQNTSKLACRIHSSFFCAHTSFRFGYMGFLLSIRPQCSDQQAHNTICSIMSLLVLIFFQPSPCLTLSKNIFLKGVLKCNLFMFMLCRQLLASSHRRNPGHCLNSVLLGVSSNISLSLVTVVRSRFNPFQSM